MKILIPDKVNDKATEILKTAGFEVENKPGISQEELIQICADADAMIVRSGIKITKEVIQAAKKLKLVVRAGVGYDNIDANAAAEAGVVVENTPFGNTNAAAEHTLVLLMLLAKHIIHAHTELKGGIWDRKKYKATELKDKTLGIIGLGNVGKKVAKVALAFEMNVLVHDPFVLDDVLTELKVKKAELEEIFKNSDYITVHVPLTDKTKDMISDEQFASMKEGVRILNVARGGVINEDALEKAINSRKVAAAALDVYGQEPPICKSLIANDRVICTPHLGASTKEAQINVAVDAANQIVEALKNNKIVHCVNKVEKLKE
ncbi:MAG: hydroxyacid dehydrogenase [Candidatus Woesearchaeota archaeon]|jgi:D-3-phosphoglycerate dehydrogenase|nr:hydroxyacid dehydrogenase [Candidatus Woesearchaeota archaeon]